MPHKKHVVEALRRAKYKFPGRQNIIVSNRWGFTDLTRTDYVKYKGQNRILDRGAHVSLQPARGKLAENAILVR